MKDLNLNIFVKNTKKCQLSHRAHGVHFYLIRAFTNYKLLIARNNTSLWLNMFLAKTKHPYLSHKERFCLVHFL